MIDNQQDPYEILDRGYSAMHYISRKVPLLPTNGDCTLCVYLRSPLAIEG